MINSTQVFDAVRRGYIELESSSNTEIIDYFDDITPDSMIGHISNIKGIVFEQEYASILNRQGIDADIFNSTNHPVTDIKIMQDDTIVSELQLKATDDISYIKTSLEENPDIVIVSTSEIAEKINTDMVIDSGIDNTELTAVVTEALSNDTTNNIIEDSLAEEIIGDFVNPISPISILGAIFGLPF